MKIWRERGEVGGRRGEVEERGGDMIDQSEEGEKIYHKKWKKILAICGNKQ